MPKSQKPSAAHRTKSFPKLRADEKLPAAPPMPRGLAKMIKVGEAEQARMDGWDNVITGAGITGRDTRMAGRLSWRGLMPETEAEQMYAGDDIARRIVEIIPRECLKNGIEFEGLEELTTDVEQEWFRLKGPERFFEAACWAKIYGGAALFMATGEDPEEFKKPLNPKNFDRIESLVLFSKWELLVRSTDLETDINDPNYGQPKYYWLTPRKGNISTLFSVKIHHSRLIRFDGKALPLRLKVFNRYWGDSVYTGVKEALTDYGLSHGSMASVLQEFRQVVYSMKDLIDALASPDSQDLTNRLSKLNAARSVFGVWFKDADEEIEFHSDNFAGVKDMLQALKERFQGCTDIPHTVLFNESASAAGGGMGQSGQSQDENWHSFLTGEQTNYYTAKFDQLFVNMLQAPGGPTQGEEPEGWDWKFKPIKTMDANGQADLETKQLTNTSKRMEMGVDDSLDAMEKHNPEKFAQLNISDTDRFKAALNQVVQSELEKQGDPSAQQLPQLPTNLEPLVKERSKGTVPATPRNGAKPARARRYQTN